MTDKLTVIDAFKESILNPRYQDLWKHYERLGFGDNPTKLGKGAPINNMIDEATGFNNKVLGDAFKFFSRYIWIPIAQDNN